MATPLASEAALPQSAGDSALTGPKPQSLEEHRMALKNKLCPLYYRPLSGMIMDGVGAGIARLFRRKTPIHYMFSNALIAGFTFSLGWGISWVRHENLGLNQLQFSAWASIMGSLVLLINKVMLDIFLSSFRGSPVDTIDSEEDLTDLEKWLDRNFDYKMPLIISIIFGSALGVFLLSEWNHANGQKELLIGPLFIAIIAAFQAFVAIYYIFPFYLVLPGRLSNYHFDMFKADPSSSEVAKRLSDMFTVIMYITLSYIILVTLGFAYFKLLNNETMLILGLFVWLPTVALYMGCQINLSKIITNSKWMMLNDIQAKIEHLLTGPDTPNVTTLEHIEKLMNYHDRVFNTPNSALHFRAVLNILNSIMLPLIALILANWDTIAKFLTPNH